MGHVLSRLESFAYRQTFLFSILFNAILFFFLYTFILIPVYNTDDDVYMRFLASGNWTKEKLSMLYASSHFIGWVLKYLYTQFPDVLWYGIYSLLNIFIAFVAITYLVLKNNRLVIGLLIILLLAVINFGFLLTEFQFTINAILLSFLGIHLSFEGFKKKNNALIILGILLLLYSCLIRYMFCVTIIMLYSITNLLADLFLNRKISLRSSLFFIGCALLIFLFNQFEMTTYSKEEKQDIAYLKYGFALMDYNVLTKINKADQSDFLSSVNWSMNDYYMISTLFHMDPVIYSEKNLSLLYSKEKNSLITSPTMVAKYIAVQAIVVFKHPYFLCLTAFCILLFFLSGFDKRIILTSAIFLTGIILSDGLSSLLYKAFPYRDQLALYFCWSLFLLLNIQILKSKKNIVVLCVAIIFTVTVSFRFVRDKKTQTLANFQNLEKVYSEVAALGPAAHIYDWGVGIPIYFVLPLKPIKIPDINLLTIYTFSGCEFIRKDWESRDVTDCYSDLLNDNSYMVIDRTLSEKNISYYIQFMKEHYQKRVEYKLVKTLANGSLLIKFNDVQTGE